MSEFINLQIYGVPVLTYGLIGTTTAILAYATYISGLGETISNTATTGSLPESSLGSINPLSAFTPITASTENDKSKPDSIIENLNPFASSEGEPKEPSTGEENEPPKTSGGGKKRKRKTPKSKLKKHKKKTIKRK